MGTRGRGVNKRALEFEMLPIYYHSTEYGALCSSFAAESSSQGASMHLCLGRLYICQPPGWVLVFFSLMIVLSVLQEGTAIAEELYGVRSSAWLLG